MIMVMVMTMLCGSDVESVVISYLEPCCLASFFMECGLDFGKKFIYDARKCMLECEEVNRIFRIFPGIILIGLSFYGEGEIMVPLDRVLYCDVMGINYMIWEKMTNIVELKLIDYNTELGKLINLRKLTIQTNHDHASPFLYGISGCKKLDTLKLLNFEFCRKDIMEMLKCKNLVNLEIDGIIEFTVYEFAKFEWNISVLKLRNCDETNLDILLSCPNVKYVRIVDWKELIDVAALVKCVKLERVEIVRCPKLMDVSAILRKCMKLRRVRVKDCGKLENLSVMGNMLDAM